MGGWGRRVRDFLADSLGFPAVMEVPEDLDALYPETTTMLVWL
jgi:hypothetical protein